MSTTTQHSRPWHICANPDCQVHVTHYQDTHPLCCMRSPEPPRPTPETEAATLYLDCDDSCVEIYTRNQDGSKYEGNVCRSDKMAELERQRDEAREAVKSSAINTNVRLFDLVRYMRLELHQASLITDEEYSWLCGGCEMANSPQGGSPSPRRLEDYDILSEKLEAMREAIKEAADILAQIPDGYDSRFFRAGQWANAALSKLQPLLKP